MRAARIIGLRQRVSIASQAPLFRFGPGVPSLHFGLQLTLRHKLRILEPRRHQFHESRDETSFVSAAGAGVDPSRWRRRRCARDLSHRNRGRKRQHGRWRSRHRRSDLHHPGHRHRPLGQSLPLRHRQPPRAQDLDQRRHHHPRGNRRGRLQRRWRPGHRRPAQPPLRAGRGSGGKSLRGRSTATTACGASAPTASSPRWPATATEARPAMAERPPAPNCLPPAMWRWTPPAISISRNSRAIACAK